MVTEARSDAGAWVDEQLSRCDTFGMSKIPVRREEITPEWLGAQLLGVGECVIASLDLEEMTGHNPDLSQLFRARIGYSNRTPAHPDVVIVKIPPEDDGVRLREAPYPFIGEAGLLSPVAVVPWRLNCTYVRRAARPKRADSLLRV